MSFEDDDVMKEVEESGQVELPQSEEAPALYIETGKPESIKWQIGYSHGGNPAYISKDPVFTEEGCSMKSSYDKKEVYPMKNDSIDAFKKIVPEHNSIKPKKIMTTEYDNSKPAKKAAYMKEMPYYESGDGFYHVADKAVHKIKQEMPDDYPCDEMMEEEHMGLKGLMIFHINTGGMNSDESLALMDKVKSHYNSIEKRLRENSIEVMWLPSQHGNSNSEYFSFV